MSRLQASSDVIFIFIEFSFLIFAVLYVFSRSTIFAWVAYGIAAVKYSLSSYYTFDMINYRNAYKSIEQFTLESTNNMESGFINLLFLMKNLGIPLMVLHGIEIVLYLFAAQYLFSAFLPKNRAIVFSLALAFFSTLGELGIYLMRQLLSMTLVYFSLGLLLRKKTLKGIFVYIVSFSFHFSSILYLPIYLSFLTKKKAVKLFIIASAYLALLILISSTELGQSVISMFSGEDSLVYDKFSSYTGGYDRRTQFGIGPLTILLMLTFVGINIWYRGIMFIGEDFIIHAFTISFMVFYVIIDRLGYSWLYSRINFIADIFLFVSNILLIMKITPKKEFPMLMTVFMTLLFLVSIRIITSGFMNNSLYIIPEF